MELIDYPLTLERRQRLYNLRRVFEETTPLSLPQIMSQTRASLLTLYSERQPPGDPYAGWLSQEEVMERVFGDSRTSGFKISLLNGVWRMTNTLSIYEHLEEYKKKLGIDWNPTLAILLVPEDDFLYRAFVRDNIATIEEVGSISEEHIASICSCRPEYNELEKAMQSYYPGWSRNVVFTDELPANLAMKKFGLKIP